MIENAVRYAIGVAFLGVLFAQAPGQDKAPPPAQADEDYRNFFKKPETPEEFWAAVKFEVGVGKYNLAAQYLKGFMDSKPDDKTLLQIEERDGMSAFLGLLSIPETRRDAKPLVERVTDVVKKHRSDPERIRNFVKNLNASDEERAYALNELRRSGAAAIPFLVDALRDTARAEEHGQILSAMLDLNENAVPPMLAALDVDDSVVRIALIDVLEKRREVRAIPFLWYSSAAPNLPDNVRKKATEALLYLQGIPRQKLPPARDALTREAERYFRHQEAGLDARANDVWRWEGKRLVSERLDKSRAEEFYGLKFAGQALDLDPTYLPAQVVFLSLALEKGFERAGIDQPLEKGAPDVNLLARVVNPDLLSQVLDRALFEKRLPIILGAVRALGDLGVVSAVRASERREPPLVKALNYPDRRVQLAAADAILRIPTNQPPRPARVVEVLRRIVAGEPVAKAMVGNFNRDRAEDLARVLQQAGYEVEIRATGREVLRRLNQAGDIDVVLIDHQLPDPPLPYLLAQLRADINYGLLPVLVTVNPVDRTDTPAPDYTQIIQRLRTRPTLGVVAKSFDPDPTGTVPVDLERRVQRLIQPYRNVWFMPASADTVYVKRTLAERIADAQDKPTEEPERQDQARVAMLWLKRMATGEVQGYDVRPAEAAILKAVESADLAPLAIAAAGHLPGRTPQLKLAEVVLGNPNDKLRGAAAVELGHHIQRHGLELTKAQVQTIEDLYRKTTNPALKENLAQLLGDMRPSPQLTGERLRSYTPTTPAAPSPAKEKEQ